MAQPTLDAVALHGAADGLGDDEAHPALRPVPVTACTTSVGRPERTPDRVTRRKSADSCRRAVRGSTGDEGARLRRRAWRDPCRGGRTGSRDPRGSASGAGSRGYGCDAGCSAGRCACSRENSPGVRSLRVRGPLQAPGTRRRREGTGVPLVTATSQRYGDLPNPSNQRPGPVEGLLGACPADTPGEPTSVAPQACIAEFRVASVAPRLHFTSCRGHGGCSNGTSPPWFPGSPGRWRCAHAQGVDNTVEWDWPTETGRTVRRMASTPCPGVARPRVESIERHGYRVSDVVDSTAPPPAEAFEQVVLQASPELRRWLDNAKPLNVHDDVMIIAVPSNFARNLLEVRFGPQVESTLTSCYGRSMKIMVTVDDGLNPSPRRWERQGPPGTAPGERDVLDAVRSRDGGSTQEPAVSPGDAAVYAAPAPGTQPVPDGVDPDPSRAERNGVSPTTVASTTLRRCPSVSAEATGARLNPKYTSRPSSSAPRTVRHAAAIAVAENPGKRQPADHLPRLRAGQDPPAHALGHYVRRLRNDPGPLRLHRKAHQRLHQRDQPEQGRRVPAALPRRGRAADRRHPVPGGQGADAGGVLPHLQHAAQRREAGGDDLQPAAEAAGEPQAAAAQPVRLGPHHRRPGPRPRDPHRHPAQEGRTGASRRRARRARVHRDPDPDQHP